MSRMPSKLYSNSSLLNGEQALQLQQVKVEMEDTEAMQRELEETGSIHSQGNFV